MRKGFNGLSGIVSDHMNENKGKNIVYAFINKRKDKLKLLHWRAGGFVLYYKRLEKGVFELPKYDVAESLAVLTYTQIIMILDGISIVSVNKKERYLSKKK
ncbi:MAG: transposase [Bacteroidetes bacterium 4572_112]|nr:MAG: transposase [Bacteroidetes bacterium 4572_112]